jgi:2,3-bisphosphoglycerate-dependent phosphoglycerate mutase
MGKLILLRHGQSIYNKRGIFTGWSDVELSSEGRKEAKRAGKLLKKSAILPDICFTSWLKRAIHTANIVLKEMEWEHIDSIRSWKLNERHYGAWQGKDKKIIEKEVGSEIYLKIRRGYLTPPPPLKKGDDRLPEKDKKYRDLDAKLLPVSESLKDTRLRVANYFYQKIAPYLCEDKTVLLSAHGNSLRALVMELEKISKNDIIKFEIPTGELIVYDFDKTLQIKNKTLLKVKNEQ